MATIYVDEVRDYGAKGEFCHMWTDGTEQDLHKFAISIGLDRKWTHYSKGLSGDFTHYDLRPHKREIALLRGAVYMPLKQWIIQRMKSKTTD